jgi:hypothetical protein
MADRLNPDRVEAPQKVSTQRMRLWQALSDFILAGGGWVTSPPYGRFVRIECNQGLSLPVELEKSGPPFASRRNDNAHRRRRFSYPGIGFIGQVTGRINVRYWG